MPGKRDLQRRDQRARILDAARRLFAKRGPEDVTMSEVARAAKVARATVFNHFGSKHALIEGITEDVLAYYLGMLENALAERETPVPVLIRSLFELMGLGIEADRRFYRSVFREIAKVRLGVDEGGPGQRAGREALERLTQLMTRGQARGEITRAHRAEDLASAFDSLVNGTITHWLYGDAPNSLQQCMRRSADVFLGGAHEGAQAPLTLLSPSLAPARTRSGSRRRQGGGTRRPTPTRRS
jgi:TetR/AcrR family transcriptional regulator of autoinduction and epiphytic fitness